MVAGRGRLDINKTSHLPISGGKFSLLFLPVHVLINCLAYTGIDPDVMAVYTTLTELELQSLLVSFNLPGLHSFHGSADGIENTTYFLTLKTGEQYVLTVFETHVAESLQPYIELMELLAHTRLPVPHPCIDSRGEALQLIAGKPALLFLRSPGKHIDIATPSLCYAVANMLARIHAPTQMLPTAFPALDAPSNLLWMQETLQFVQHSLAAADVKLLLEQITLAADLQLRQLPTGIIHGDLFRDNVLLVNNSISAVIDFYNARRDALLMDLAIMANDWCYAGGDGKQIAACVDALLNGYQQHRPLLSVETHSWADCLQVAAARLWLSRQKRVVLSRAGSKGLIKDPDEYRRLLLGHIGGHIPANK